MSAILPFIHIDSGSLLARYFTPYQIAWIGGIDLIARVITIFDFRSRTCSWYSQDGSAERTVN
jgi:hypothetical protein